MKKITAQRPTTQTSNELFGLVMGTYISSTLLLVRVVYSGRSTELYLLWNLFLAWIPFILSHLIVRNFHPLRKNPVLLVIAGLIWLLFLPNAPYVLTDLKHLQYLAPVPFWFDLVLLCSFALNGLYLGLYSLSHIQGVVSNLYGQKRAWFMIGLIMYLTSLGIYLGRILRWNTWDVVTHPILIIDDVVSRLLHPLAHFRMHVFVLLLAVTLYVIYRVFYFSFFEKKHNHFHQ
ncbi:MAG: DUF1361 domain-containing protein [Patescibacteria group bacterium]